LREEASVLILDDGEFLYCNAWPDTDVCREKEKEKTRKAKKGKKEREDSTEFLDANDGHRSAKVTNEYIKLHYYINP